MRFAPTVVRVLLSTFLLAMSGWFLAVERVVAQDATASPAPTPVFPDPSECTVEPLALPLSLGTPAAMPAILDGTPSTTATQVAGQAADIETARLVSATIRESVACENAREPLRQYALLSERFLQELLGGMEPDQQSEFFFATPEALTETQRVGLLVIGDVRVTPDGHATAFVSYAIYEGDESIEQYEVWLIFVKVGNRWLIDGFVPEISKAAPVP